MIKEVFRRKEVKYLLSGKQYQELLQMILPYLEKDEYFKGTNCSIYFDTSSRYLAIHSLEKPLYKEKIRLRSYGVPKLSDIVFVEIKKKFDGLGSKRRIAVKLADFYDFISGAELKTDNEQIRAELSECFSRYNLMPTLYLAYDRTSYCDRETKKLRITFDKNVRSREADLKLEAGDYGDLYFEDGTIVMEVKTLDTLPLWFAKALSRMKIYPASFSKYGRVYEKILEKEKNYV